MRSGSLVAFCAFMLAFTDATSAHANGRFPEANQLVVNEGDPDFLVLRMTFGILVSKDRGKTWDWICESAIGYSGTYDPPVGIAAERTLLAGTFDGLAVSENAGCSWVRKPPFVTEYVKDVATFPGDPARVIAVNNNFSAFDDAGVAQYRNQIAISSDGARTFTLAAASIDPTLIVETLDFARSDPKRIYVSASRVDPSVEASLFTSTDGAQAFTRHPIPLVPGETNAFIAAVDPNDADRVYVRTVSTGADGSATLVGGRILVTTNGGTSFKEIWSGGPPFGFALSPDGKKVWVGSGSGGLFMADTATFNFSQKQPFVVKCLTAVGNRLYVCATEFGSGFVLGESVDDGTTFTPVYKLSQIRGPLQCAANTETAKCVAEWPQLKVALGIDGGTEPPPPPPPESSCGCTSAIGANVGAGSIAAFALAALAVARRRRR